MAKYYVDIPCTTIETYAVEAESEEEAKDLVASGEGTFCSNDTIPCQDPDTNNWHAFTI